MENRTEPESGTEQSKILNLLDAMKKALTLQEERQKANKKKMYDKLLSPDNIKLN